MHEVCKGTCLRWFPPFSSHMSSSSPCIRLSLMTHEHMEVSESVYEHVQQQGQWVITGSLHWAIPDRQGQTALTSDASMLRFFLSTAASPRSRARASVFSASDGSYSCDMRGILDTRNAPITTRI